FAHVPIQLFGPVPADVLILGGGDGLLARELLKYGARVRRITIVEPDPAVARLGARERRLRLLNGGSLDDAKVRVVLADPFFFAASDRERYDAVYLELPAPRDEDTARYFSAEFLRRAAGRLKPEGFGALDYPLGSEDSAA